MTASTAKKPAAPRSRAPKATDGPTTDPDVIVTDTSDKIPTPSEMADAKIEREELVAELLADMPALRPANRFRLSHRNAFHNLSLEALKSGAFDRDDMEFDPKNPKDIEDFQKLQDFVVSIDEWAESIAEDKLEYDEWSQGKTEETFMALFALYKADLGESSGSAS